MALEISAGNGPELPMQVVQPKATRLKPIASRSVCRPDLERYSATTCEPGASEVFTHGLTVSPLASAFRASKPAPIITLGLDVLVQEVIAAITTSPLPRSWLRPGTGKRPLPAADLPNSLSTEVASEGCRSKMSLVLVPPLENSFSIASAKLDLTSLSATRSCGRLGPAMDGSTLASSSLSTSVKIGSGVVLVWNMPCALA